MKLNKSEKILYAILIISIFAIVVLATPLILAKFRDNPESMQDAINSCLNNQTLENSSKCAVNTTSSFYKYNSDNLGKDLSFNELVQEGGVCRNWSEYYSEFGKDLGYNTENIIIKVSDDLYHEFSVWSDSKGYCIIDQTEFKCFEFGGN